jgi:hypothetical protein
MRSDRDQFLPDLVLFLMVLALFMAGQFLIGSYLPEDGSFHYDAPADVDFLYYAGIINQMKHGFPPQNPAYGGVAPLPGDANPECTLPAATGTFIKKVFPPGMGPGINRNRVRFSWVRPDKFAWN